VEQLIYAGVIGFFIGLAVHYLLPGRHSYGLLLLPAIAAAVTCAVWAGVIWIGFTLDGGWIWAASLGAALVVSLVVGLVLPRARRSSDERLLHELSGGHA
jgi:hypothetical protein